MYNANVAQGTHRIFAGRYYVRLSSFLELPDYLARMFLFESNSGTREEEVCGLRWDWEVQVPELETSVFIIPGDKVKNTEERLVVLNRIARSVIDTVRGVHPEYVFVYCRRVATS
jgi:integrase